MPVHVYGLECLGPRDTWACSGASRPRGVVLDKRGRVPVYRAACYACDARATGAAEHRGTFVPACARHADPSIRAFAACIYCSGPVRSDSADIDGDFAHVTCHRAARE